MMPHVANDRGNLREAELSELPARQVLTVEFMPRLLAAVLWACAVPTRRPAMAGSERRQ